MEIKLNDSTVNELKELAILKNISLEEAASIVLEEYTLKHIVLVKLAQREAEKAIDDYGK